MPGVERVILRGAKKACIEGSGAGDPRGVLVHRGKWKTPTVSGVFRAAKMPTLQTRKAGARPGLF